MSSTQAGLLILTVVFSGALLGALLGRLLPEHHLSSETKAVVTVAMATVATLSAMVLGLLVSTASSSFSTRNTEVIFFFTDTATTEIYTLSLHAASRSPSGVSACFWKKRA